MLHLFIISFFLYLNKSLLCNLSSCWDLHSSSLSLPIARVACWCFFAWIKYFSVSYVKTSFHTHFWRCSIHRSMEIAVFWSQMEKLNSMCVNITSANLNLFTLAQWLLAKIYNFIAKEIMSMRAKYVCWYGLLHKRIWKDVPPMKLVFYLFLRLVTEFWKQMNKSSFLPWHSFPILKNEKVGMRDLWGPSKFKTRPSGNFRRLGRLKIMNEKFGVSSEHERM